MSWIGSSSLRSDVCPSARLISDHPPEGAAPCHLQLRGGTPLLMRPIRGEDKPLLLDFFRRQSPEARYMRFMGAIAELSESTLRDLTEVDHVNHEAWIAIDGGARDGLCVGVARYVRLAKAPREAEVAVAVVDSHQRLGIGSALLERVAGSAAAHGIDTFHSCVFDSNLAVIGILQRHGATMTGRDGGILRFSVSAPVPRAVSPIRR